MLNILHIISTMRLKKFGYVKRMDTTRWSNILLDYVLEGRRKSGRLKRTLMEDVNEEKRGRELK